MLLYLYCHNAKNSIYILFHMLQVLVHYLQPCSHKRWALTLPEHTSDPTVYKGPTQVFLDLI